MQTNHLSWLLPFIGRSMKHAKTHFTKVHFKVPVYFFFNSIIHLSARLEDRRSALHFCSPECPLPRRLVVTWPTRIYLPPVPWWALQAWGVSSEPSMQSLSPSHTQSPSTQWPLLHLNSPAEHSHLSASRATTRWQGATGAYSPLYKRSLSRGGRLRVVKCPDI